MTDIPVVPKKRTGLAISSLVCGILGGYASTLSIPSIICGHIALVKIKREPTLYGAKKVAITGLVLGYLGLVLSVVHGGMRGWLRAEMQKIPHGLHEQSGLKKVSTKYYPDNSIESLISMLGKDIHSQEIQTWLSSRNESEIVEGKRDFLKLIPYEGITFCFFSDKLTDIQISRSYRRVLPFGIHFSLNRAEIEKKIGLPEKLINSTSGIPGGPVWEILGHSALYLSKGISIHYRIDGEDEMIESINFHESYKHH